MIKKIIIALGVIVFVIAVSVLGFFGYMYKFQQIVNEGNRVKTKYLATLDKTITSDQIKEMSGKNVKKMRYIGYTFELE